TDQRHRWHANQRRHQEFADYFQKSRRHRQDDLRRRGKANQQRRWRRRSRLGHSAWWWIGESKWWRRQSTRTTVAQRGVSGGSNAREQSRANAGRGGNLKPQPSDGQRSANIRDSRCPPSGGGEKRRRSLASGQYTAVTRPTYECKTKVA